MSKLKLGAIIFITFIVGVGIGSAASKSSTTGKVSSDNKEEIQQSTVQGGGNALPLAQATPESGGKVVVKSHNKRIEYGYPKIVGEVVNNTASSASFVQVTATFYDSKGEVVGTDFTYASDTASTPLAPQATAPFEITASQGLTFDNYKLDVTWR
ncbi:hypothetical protein A2697_01380 [Candidatus Curtissbacteria bacterium RIFCSPHIGHO2_01_FULL_41_44]|uniref:Uncharacterized protein n=1 Tax=Candidatus Curtissbacteria bacterium RIFCSPLOWO2_01_FULL_42_50 TaxID=1797730 RepID=A0A1F5H3H4_9BACT|nr:MAG: hypothetical protein A3C33_00595 [Candidatus Curtissbacteria bacterium RIFCSPHIGHO2_02_FULL_42_58]OGD94561.1 MAG: hypothetical protein A2697_01380 [Candidatus Curtissbacteria bacterium RIFCSPHIGHO2_01_FULL_41_44]OGD97944.1 MAG: hypothetical protein A3E71_03855 [Candidatus Curtissbacteria bacterium RIFCSPHIGHO2_12_FULL_42_33]OGD98594.1 MAG: hypothetical protein A3B54_05425 [Candidatus Curtissbacteria bacterium RIFCSPLOWO2_01_FULL_42_50]OGE11197.1 MAG: hypothetical protein A3H87_01500 [Ca